MALDGITVAALTKELKDELLGSRVYKIAQPENDELLITFKTNNGQQRLVISSDATLPLVYLTDTNKPSPMTAPNFCMLLRKHIQNGRVTNIEQPSLERIIIFEIEHMDELGDMRHKRLIVELMGKHSNIIFTDEDNKIIDSIKHINSFISSVREVLPGRDYFIPMANEKLDPLTVDKNTFISAVSGKALVLSKALYTTFTGFSPIMSEELCYRAGIDSSIPANALHEIDGFIQNNPDESTNLLESASNKPLANESTSDNLIYKLYAEFNSLVNNINSGVFVPNIIFRDDIPVDFGVVDITQYSDLSKKDMPSVSSMLSEFYSKKAEVTRIRQKSVDLRKIITTALERNYKKYDLQIKQLKDTEKKDKYKVYGELINTYGYGLDPMAKSFEADNYYTGEKITIPLDNTMTPQENAKKYFEKYNKLKRTEEALSVQAAETKNEIEHLESISSSLDIALLEEDLTQIKEEMIESGYIKHKGVNKKVKITSKPFHYVSSDGFHMYVGKNNFQNDELTFKFANGNDWWFHAKKMPGSHVIVRTEGKELPDRAYEEAAALAAYYSKGREQTTVEIDYVIKKEVKKPAGSKPGFVVYYTNYSMSIKPDISKLTEIK